MGWFKTKIRWLLCFPFKFYQFVFRPIFPCSCRFYPSCSDYAIEAMLHHGLIRGLLLILIRLGRCHPYSLGGYDPIPEKRENF